ncbi:MAG: DUF5666 domain-containing protein [Acidobacteriaceae bacterium]
MRRKAMMVLVAAVMLSTTAVVVRAQDSGQDSGQGQRRGRGAFAGMQRVTGEVTGVSGSTLTVKTEDGATMTVVTTDNTRVMKGRGNTVKVADLKVGDGVMAAGILDAPNKTLHAAIVFATDAAQVAAMKANLGKTYIVGRVTAVDMDNAKMTVERPDHVMQTIGFDETTSFRRGGRGMGGRMGADGAASGGAASAPTEAPEAGGESITLADIKVGEMVRGRGSVKDGVFVPTELVVMERGGRRGTGDAASGGNARPGGNPNPQNQ